MVIINLYKTIVIIIKKKEKMQFLIELDFNIIYDFITKLNINGLSNYLFSDYEDIDECFCGNCCSCFDSKTYMVSEKSWNFILIKTIGLGVLGFLLLLWINFYNKENKISPKSESQSQFEKMIKKSDIPLAWGLYFQDGASPSFEGIVDLHNRIMFYLVVILFGVTWIMLSIMWNFNKSGNKLVYRYLNHGTLIELIWTVGPAFVLVAIAFPSFKLLYLMDEVIDPAMTVKVTGHQWYWEYEYADFLNEENEIINFDSYMKDEASLEKGELRMLEVDNPVVLPVDTHIRFIITAADVLHDWAVPALALKIDACPGKVGPFIVKCKKIK